MKNTLSISRIWLLIKYEYMSNLSAHIRLFSISVSIVLFILLFRQYTIFNFTCNWTTYCLLTFALTELCVGSLACSRHMSFLNDKSDCARYLMIPASRPEKFIAQTLIVFFVCTIECNAAIICADTIREVLAIITQGTDTEYNSAYLSLFTNNYIGNHFYVQIQFDSNNFTTNFDLSKVRNLIFLELTASVIWAMSLFILCSNIWSKHSLALGITINIIILFLGGNDIDTISENIANINDNPKSAQEAYEITNLAAHKILWVLTAIHAVLSISTLLLAYYFFTRKQLKNRFFSFNFKKLAK